MNLENLLEKQLNRKNFLLGFAAAPLLLKQLQPVECPIYMFHLTGGPVLESVILSNLQKGKVAITVTDLADILSGEKEVPQEPIFSLTFDDGYLIQYQQALPVLRRYNIPATFYVMGTGWEGDGVHTYMKPEHLIELSDEGHEIGSHTINHPTNLISLRRNNIGAYLAEIEMSRYQLENLIQKEVTTFAYPNGVYDNVLKQDLAEIYQAAVSTTSGSDHTLNSLYELRRIRIN